MSKEKIKTFIIAGILATSWILVSSAIINNGIYSNYKTSINALDKASGYSKVGKATMTDYMGLIKLGDDSYQSALTNGKITKIHHIDMEAKGTFLKRTNTTYVYGE